MQATGKQIVQLLDPRQPAEVRRAAALVLGELGGRDADVAKALCDQLHDSDSGLRLEVIRAVGKLKVEKALPALEDPRATDVLWDRIAVAHAPEARAAALQALGKWVGTPGKEQLGKLFACAADSDFRVAAPSLMILKALPDGAKMEAGWLSLLRAPDLMVR